MTILAITLTTTLFSALFSTLLGLKNSFDDFSYRSVGTCADAQLYNMDEKAEETLKSAGNISKTGYVKEIGTYTNELLFNNPATILYADDTASGLCYINPTKGSAPAGEDEIVLDTFMMNLLGIEEKVGAEAEITFLAGGQTEVTHKFTVSGYYQVSGNCPEHIIRVSERYADRVIADYGLERYLGANINYRSLFSPQSANEILRNRLESSGSRSLLVFNPVKADSDMEGNIELIACGAVLCLIIFVTGFLIINNIFRIKLASEIRYYGLLKTIGVTARQLRRLIRNETLILCGIGVPLGLGIGYTASRLIMPQLMLITSVETAAAVPYIPAVLIFSAVFSIVTVLISNSAAVSKTSKVSPVEALRFNETASFRKVPKTNKHGLSALVDKSLKINRSKTVPVILSLALAISLFTGVSFLINGISHDSEKSERTVAFEIGNRDYFLGNPDGLPLTEEQINTFKKDIPGELCGCTYESDQVMIDLPGYSGKETDPIAGIIGIDDSLTGLTGIEDLPDLGPEEPYPAIIEWSEAAAKYKIGDVVELTINKTTAINRETGEKIDNLALINGDSGKIEFKRESRSFKVRICAGTDRIPDSISPKYSFMNSVRFIVGKDALDKMTGGNFHIVSYLIDTKDEDQIEHIESYLSDLTEKNTTTLRYMSSATSELEFLNLSKAFSITGYFLSLIVGVIAVLNFVNAVMTEAVTRRREFALLRAVGTTASQIKNLLIRECIFYTAGAFVLGIPLEILVMLMLKTADIAWIAVTPASLFLPFLVLLPLFAVLSFVVPTVIYNKNSSKSIMDEFRETY